MIPSSSRGISWTMSSSSKKTSPSSDSSPSPSWMLISLKEIEDRGSRIERERGGGERKGWERENSERNEEVLWRVFALLCFAFFFIFLFFRFFVEGGSVEMDPLTR